MSTAASIANFYVDQDGQEQPIRYRAADLVNRLAPEGYVWAKRSHAQDLIAAYAKLPPSPIKMGQIDGKMIQISPTLEPVLHEEDYEPYYIAVKVQP